MLKGLRAVSTLLLAGALAVTASCELRLSSPSAPAQPMDGPSAASSPDSSISPSQAAGMELAIEELPVLRPNPATLTAVCDPEPIQLDPEAGETSLFCFDGLVLGLRAARTATQATFRRAYLMRPACATTPCSQAELSTATVTVWTDLVMFAVRVDSRLDAVSVPQVVLVDPWPQPGAFTPPDSRRAELDGAPLEVATRTPYPYCGRATFERPEEVLACFRNSLLLGKPVEAILDAVATEGGELIDIYRFDGVGAITRFERSDSRWFKQHGSLVLGPGGRRWTFDPWGKGERIG